MRFGRIDDDSTEVLRPGSSQVGQWWLREPPGVAGSSVSPAEVRALGRARDGVPISTYAPWQDDTDFRPPTTQSQGNTLVDVWRCHELWSLVGELREVPGAILEVGVWRGGTGALIARALPAPRHRRRVYLCDTWEGVVKTGVASTPYYRDGKHDDTSLDIVRNAAARLGLGNVECLRGYLPRRHGQQVAGPRRSGCATSTSTSTSRPRTCSSGCGRGCRPRGVVVFDDYGFPACQASPSSSTSAHLRAATGSLARTTLNGHLVVKTLDGASERQVAEVRRLVRPARTRSRPVDRFGVWLSLRADPPPRALAGGHAMGRLRLRLTTHASPARCSTTRVARCSSTWRCAADLKAHPGLDRRRGRAPGALAACRRRHARRGRCASRCSSTCGSRSGRST